MRFLMLITFSLLFFFNAQTASAAESFIGVSPSVIQISAKENSTPVANISLRNLTPNNQKVRIEVKPFKAANSQDGKIEYIKESDSNQALYKDIEFYDGEQRSKNINIDGYGSKNIKVIIPLDSSQSQDYYFSILFIAEPSTAVNETGSLIESAVATNVFLSVGNPSPSIVLEDFSSPLYAGNNEIRFTILAQNSSKTRDRLRGKIDIYNLFGSLVDTIEIKPVNILSGSSRYLGNDIKGIKTDHPMAIWKPKFMLGLYTTKLILQDSQGQVVSGGTNFLAIPALPFLIAIFAATFLTGVFLRYRSRINRLKATK